MPFKTIFLLVFIMFLTNCSTNSLNNKTSSQKFKHLYSNKGFALIYDEKLFTNKIINKKIDERSLIIFQKNIKTNSQVKITNILNNKSIIAKVGKKTKYPLFNNSVISIRIAKELDLNLKEPYIEIVEVPLNSMFIAKKTQTYDEEKKVADKVPVNTISISDLNNTKKEDKKTLKVNFSYNIKIADFYFNKTAILMGERIKNETPIENPKIKKITDQKFRVYLGPFDNINSLQKSFNDINILEFENIEIIKND